MFILNRIGAKFCKNDGIDLLTSRLIVTPKPIPPLQSEENWIKEGQMLVGQKLYADALVAYEQALLLDPHSVPAHFYKGHVLDALERYDEALSLYERAIHFHPYAAAPYCHKGHALRHLQRNTEALTAYEQAVQLGSPDIKLKHIMGRGLYYSTNSATQMLRMPIRRHCNSILGMQPPIIGKAVSMIGLNVNRKLKKLSKKRLP